MHRSLKILFFVFLFFILSFLEFSPLVFVLIIIVLAIKPGFEKLIVLTMGFLLIHWILLMRWSGLFQEEIGQFIYVSLVFALWQKNSN